jgi:lysophospholipase L1-like esterase
VTAIAKFTSLGDSIANGYGLGANQRYADLCNLWFQATAVSLAVNGSTTSDVLASQFPTALANGSDTILLQGGINDVNASIPQATTIANYASMVASCRAAGITPVIIGMLPNATATLATTVALYAAIKAWAQANAVSFVDLWPLFDDGTGHPWASRCPDGTHPDGYGSAAITKAITEVMGYQPSIADMQLLGSLILPNGATLWGKTFYPLLHALVSIDRNNVVHLGAGPTGVSIAIPFKGANVTPTVGVTEGSGWGILEGCSTDNSLRFYCNGHEYKLVGTLVS